MKTSILSLTKGVFLLCLGTLLCGLTGCSGKAEQKVDVQDEQQLFIGDSIAIAQTKYGKVKGYILRGVYTFCGIPYGASTAGENRFMPPKEPEPWEGIRPAFGVTRHLRLRKENTVTVTVRLQTIGIIMT